MALLLHWAAPAVASPALERLADQAGRSPLLSAELVARARAGCAEALCFARALAALAPDRVWLERVRHPNTDMIRWARDQPSVEFLGLTPDGVAELRLSGFRRKAPRELRAALDAASERRLGVDLRGNPGGDLGRMTRMARMLLGPGCAAADLAALLRGPVCRTARVAWARIDAETESSALALAHVLNRAGACLLRQGPARRAVAIKRRVSVDHDWRLLLAVELLALPPAAPCATPSAAPR